MIGMDSPVNMLSLIIQLPFNKIQSQGTVQPSLTSMRSPGTIYLDIICYLFSWKLLLIIT